MQGDLLHVVVDFCIYAEVVYITKFNDNSTG